MSGPPCLPLHVMDYMSGTMHLSIEESGAYLHVLMMLWAGGGYLDASDPRRMSTMLRMTVEEWNAVSPSILKLLTRTKKGWTQKRLLRELTAARDASARRRAAGKKGGVARSLKLKENMAKQCHGDATETTREADGDDARVLSRSLKIEGNQVKHCYSIATALPRDDGDARRDASVNTANSLKIEGNQGKQRHEAADARPRARARIYNSNIGSIDVRKKEKTTTIVVGKKKERSPSPSAPSRTRSVALVGSRIDPDWRPGEDEIAFAGRHGIPEDRVPDVWEHFVAFHVAKGDTSKSWKHSWRTWVMKDENYRRSRQGAWHQPRRTRMDDVRELIMEGWLDGE